jgi:hypothetical protein
MTFYGGCFLTFVVVQSNLKYSWESVRMSSVLYAHNVADQSTHTDITEDDSAYQRQHDAVKQALIDYGADNVAGITVGNEFILNSLCPPVPSMSSSHLIPIHRHDRRWSN